MAAQQTRQPDRLWRGLDGIAEVDVDVEAQAGGGEFGGEGDSDASVGIVVADDLCGCSCGVEEEPIVGGQTGHGSHQVQDVVDVAGQLLGM